MRNAYLVQTDEQNSKFHGGNTALAKVNQAFFDLFLEASESENKFIKIDETKKRTSTPSCHTLVFLV